MKKLIRRVFIILILPVSYWGQLATVTGGNFGASISGGLELNSPNGGGFGGSFGITTSFYEVLFPEIDYSYYSSDFGNDNNGDQLVNQSQMIGFGLNNKIPFGSIKMGKSKHQECWYLNLKLLFDYKYQLRIKDRSNFDFNPKNESGFNFGLGIRPSFSGSDKSRVAWAFFYDVYYHLDLNNSYQPTLNTDIKQNGLYLRFTFLHYKTSDMLGSGSKKKAYNRKY